MFKKAIPLVLIFGLALAGCGTNGTVPKDNETPMEDTNRDWTPKVNDEQTGPNMDGLNDGDGNMNGNGTEEGIMNGNDGTGNERKLDGNNGTGEDAIQEGTTNEGAMENDLDRKSKTNR